MPTKITNHTIAGAALAVITLICFGYAINLDKGDWGTWIGGAGTIATLLYAIHIARAGDKQRHDEQMNLARVMAAEFWLILPSLQSDIRFIDERLTEAIETRSFKRLPACASILLKFNPWESEKLAKMACLADSAAAKLAMAAAEIQMCAKQLQVFLEAADQMADSKRDETLLDVRESMRCVAGYLQDGFRQCDLVLETHVV